MTTESQRLWQGCATQARADVLWPAARSRFSKGIANLPCVASKLSNMQSLTHAVVALEPISLCAFGPAVLHGCTPRLW